MADHSPTINPPTRPGDGQDPMRRRLTGLRRLAKALLLSERALRLVWVFGAVVLGLALADYWLRMPAAVRLILWAAGLGLLVAGVRSVLMPAIRFRPTLTQVALRLEGLPEPGLRGSLASGLELAGEPREGLAGQLAGLASRDAAEHLERLGGVGRALSLSRLRRTGLAAVCALAPIIALGVWRPDLAIIGSQRVLAPWSSAAWPKRTQVVAGGLAAAHPIGVALPLRAVIVRSPEAPGRTNVAVNYQLIVDGEPRATQQALLTFQPPRQDDPNAAPGEVYERLIDTAALVPPELRSPDRKIEVAVTFSTADDRTEPRVVRLVEPPALRAARAEVELPAYAAPSRTLGTEFVNGVRDLSWGPGEVGNLGPVLAGSRVTLHLTLNKPVPVPPEPGAAQARWLASALPGLDEAEGLEVRFDGPSCTIRLEPARSVRFGVTPRDEFGVQAVDEATFRLEVRDDRAAAVSIVDPPQDEGVLPTAVLDVVGEGRDDVALAWVTVESTPAKPPGASVGAAPEAIGPPAEIIRATPAGEARREQTLVRATTTIDLSTRDLAPGDELWLVARAADVRPRAQRVPETPPADHLAQRDGRAGSGGTVGGA
jgi:hypothetical protein